MTQLSDIPGPGVALKPRLGRLTELFGGQPVSFGILLQELLGEIVTGFLLMVGVFCRVWCMLMLFMFTKLMVVDFGWAELPHLYFMSIFLVLLFSNRLSGDFAWIEGRTAAAAWDGKMARALLIAVAIALFLSTLVVYPGLYVLTKIPNSSVFGDYASGIKGGT
jgi:hypothetical protein